MKKKYLVGLVFIVLGIVAFVYRLSIPEYVDANGMLHENLFYIVVGYLSILLGLAIVAISGIIDFTKNRKQKISHS